MKNTFKQCGWEAFADIGLGVAEIILITRLRL